MDIKVHFMGTPFIDGIQNGESVQVEESTTLAAFLLARHVQEEYQPFIVMFINGEPCEATHVLQEGDELTLYLPVSGG